MAQNITLMGASYSAVPAVTLPKTGGGTASFTDVSDTTATAADVASGTYFYTAAGVYTEGTASGGGGSGPYVVGVVPYNKFTVNNVISQAGGTVTVSYTGTSSQPLPPGSQLVVADVNGTTLIVLKASGTISVGATFTFTMPSESVAVRYSGGM